jgi:CBS domain-containing protein
MTGVQLEQLTARDVLSAPALTVAPYATLWQAWQLMMASGLRHLVVCSDGRVVGVIDDRAVFAQWPMGPLALRRTHVRDVMRAQTTCVLADTDLQTVATIMVADAIDAAPVVDPDGEVLGIVTSGDLTAAIAAHGLWRLAL